MKCYFRCSVTLRQVPELRCIFITEKSSGLVLVLVRHVVCFIAVYFYSVINVFIWITQW